MNDNHSLRFFIPIDKNNLDNYEISLLDFIKNSEEMLMGSNIINRIEATYGPMAVIGGKRIRVNDYVNQGDGYDIDDSFIDNSRDDEALLVAPELETKYGGFFVNSKNSFLNEDKFVLKYLLKTSQPQNVTKVPSKGIKTAQKLVRQAKAILASSTNNSIIQNSPRNLTKSAVIEENVTFLKYGDITSKRDDSINISKEKNGDITSKHDDSINISKEKEIKIKESRKDVDRIELLPGFSEEIQKNIALSKEIFMSKPDGVKSSPRFNRILMELDSMLANHTKIMRSNAYKYISQEIDLKYESILKRINKIKFNRKKRFKDLEDAIEIAMIVSKENYKKSDKKEKKSSEVKLISEDQRQKQAEVSKYKFNWTPSCKSILFKIISSELDGFRIPNCKGTPVEYLQDFYKSHVINLFPDEWMTVCELIEVSLPTLSKLKLIGNEFHFIVSPTKQHLPKKITANTECQMKDSTVNKVTKKRVRKTALDLNSNNVSLGLKDAQPKSHISNIQPALPVVPPRTLELASIKSGLVRNMDLPNNIDKIISSHVIPPGDSPSLYAEETLVYQRFMNTELPHSTPLSSNTGKSEYVPFYSSKMSPIKIPLRRETSMEISYSTVADIDPLVIDLTYDFSSLN